VEDALWIAVILEPVKSAAVGRPQALSLRQVVSAPVNETVIQRSFGDRQQWERPLMSFAGQRLYSARISASKASQSRFWGAASSGATVASGVPIGVPGKSCGLRSFLSLEETASHPEDLGAGCLHRTVGPADGPGESRCGSNG